MVLYNIIENRLINPLDNVVNKINSKDKNLKITNKDEVENDITLVFDLICYLEKNTLNDIAKYFNWLIAATFLIFKEYDVSKLDWFLGVYPKEQELLYSSLFKMVWLNQRAVNEKKYIILYYIDYFYYWIMEYGTEHPKNFNYDVFPILKTIKSLNELHKEKYQNSNNILNNNIEKQCKLLGEIQKEILEIKKQITFYRIKNNFISNSEIYYLVELLYFILSRKFEVKQSKKYEPCFSIVAKMIDNDVFDKHYEEIIDKIKNHHDYFFGKENVYIEICGFHIITMAYLIYKNQYQLLKSYMYYEEPIDSTSQKTRPQIPNNINSILWNFIGNNSVFDNTQTFSANVSSYKYKFYILFLLLINSKRFAENYSKNIANIKKKNWNYDFIKESIKYHNDCSIDFNNTNFDIVMSYINLKSYKDFLDKFEKETELLKTFECKKDDIKFIKKILDKTIKNQKIAQNKLLKEKFSKVVLKDFSPYKQNYLGIKNLNEFINFKINLVCKTINKIKFYCPDYSNFKSVNINLYEKIFSKKQILSGQYEYLFDVEPLQEFYLKMFNTLIDNCHQILSVDDIANEDIKNYEVLSNFDYKQSFKNFGFDEKDITVKETIVNGKKEDNSEYGEVCSIKINDKELKVFDYNYYFNRLNNNETYPHTMLIFDPQKISINIGESQEIQYKDMEKGNVKIIDNTQVTIKLPKDKSLGFFIVKNKKQ